MASGKISKNSKKGFKEVQQVIKKERPKKEFLFIEIDGNGEALRVYDNSEDTYKGKEVVDVVKRYGKTYLKVKNV